MSDLEQTIAVMLSYVTQSHNKSHTLKKILALPQWKTFCHFSSASELLEYFNMFFIDLKCDSSSMRMFFETCGHQVADWSLRDERLSTLKMLLSHAHSARYDLWRGKCNPLVKSLYLGEMSLAFALLKYGYTLEYSDRVFKRLVNDTVKTLVDPSDHLACRRRLLQTPNPTRTFLLLFVIRTYVEHTYHACDIVFRHIWRRQPVSFLCRDEFFAVFHPFKFNEAMLERIFDRYCFKVGFVSYRGYNPYSLLHYSRCAVRRAMKECMSLPTGVEELPVPEELKPYLLFH